MKVIFCWVQVSSSQTSIFLRVTKKQKGEEEIKEKYKPFMK